MGTAKWRIIAAIRWKHGGSEECSLARDGRQSLASCSDDYYVVVRAACTSTMFAIRLLTVSLEFLLVMGVDHVMIGPAHYVPELSASYYNESLE